MKGEIIFCCMLVVSMGAVGCGRGKNLDMANGCDIEMHDSVSNAISEPVSSVSDKFKEITANNFEYFLMYWDSVSHHIAAHASLRDSVVNDIISHAMNAKDYYGHRYKAKKDKYRVVPFQIPVVRYDVDVDMTEVFSEGFRMSVFCEKIPPSKCKYDTITPELPFNGLYLTDDVYELILRFIGGYRDDATDKYVEQNYKNGEIIKKRLDVETIFFNRRGRCSFPYVTRIKLFNNFAIVSRITDVSCGDEVWFRNDGNGFVPIEKLAFVWHE